MDVRRLLLRAVMAIAGLMLIVACGSTGADDAGDTTTSGAPDPGDTAGGGGGEGEEVTLTVWASRESHVPPDQFAEFMEQNPNITIEWDVQDGDDILQQLQRMRNAGESLPDVIHDDSFLMGAYQSAELLLPLDEYVQRWQDEDPESFESLLPVAFDETTFDGNVYGVSPAADFDVFFYNLPVFEEAGVEVPFQSWDAVLAGLQDIKAAHPDIIPLAVQAQAGEGVTAMRGFMHDVGVPFDGATPDLTSEAGVYVIDWFKEAQESGLLPSEAIAWGQSESRGAFIAQRAALLVEGLNASPDFLEAPELAYGEDWSMTPKPTSITGEAQDGSPMSAARTWAVTADSEHPYEATLVIRYLASAQNLINTIQNRVIMPRNLEALNSPELDDYLPFLTEELKDAYVEAVPAPAAPNAPEVEAVLEQLFGEIVVGTDESAEDLAARYQEILEEL
jgi:multiple sugar transport system substrate-binding protein